MEAKKKSVNYSFQVSHISFCLDRFNLQSLSSLMFIVVAIGGGGAACGVKQATSLEPLARVSRSQFCPLCQHAAGSRGNLKITFLRLRKYRLDAIVYLSHDVAEFGQNEALIMIIMAREMQYIDMYPPNKPIRQPVA